jgi:hypothetical protein
MQQCVHGALADNSRRYGAQWRFRTEDATIKLQSLYLKRDI